MQTCNRLCLQDGFYAQFVNRCKRVWTSWNVLRTRLPRAIYPRVAFGDARNLSTSNPNRTFGLLRHYAFISTLHSRYSTGWYQRVVAPNAVHRWCEGGNIHGEGPVRREPLLWINWAIECQMNTSQVWKPLFRELEWGARGTRWATNGYSLLSLA